VIAAVFNDFVVWNSVRIIYFSRKVVFHRSDYMTVCRVGVFRGWRNPRG